MTLAGTSIAPTAILLVCNPGEEAELRRHFDTPLASGAVVVVVGDGGDETLSEFRRAAPVVVVICATLDRGDARALLEAMRAARPGPERGFRTVLIGDERGPVRNALDAADFGVDRFVARPIAGKALRFAVSSSIDAARGKGRIAVASDGRVFSSTSGGSGIIAPKSGASAVTMIGAPTPSAPMAATTAPATTGPDSATMIVPAMPTMPGTGRAIPPAAPRGSRPDLAAELPAAPEPAPPEPIAPSEAATPPLRIRPQTLPPELAEPPPEAVRTELRARWTALADAMSDHDVDLGAADDDPDDDAEPVSAEPLVERPAPAPVVIRPRRSTVDPRLPPDGAARAAAAGAIEAPADVPSLPSLAPRAPRPAAIGEVDQPDVRDEFLEQSVDEPGADEPEGWAPREPTLILSEHAAAAVPRSSAGDGPPSSGPVANPFDDSIVVTERRVDERWTAGARLQAVADDAAARARELAEVAPIAVQEPIRADLGDELVEPSGRGLPGGGSLVDADDELGPPPDDPPMRPSDPAMPSGTDFARELRRKMSAMAQRLFKSAEAAPAPAVDLAPRHDHKTEIDLAALVDGPPAGGGVTEIEARDEAQPREDTPGTSDTQVRLGAESGDILRGVSDAAAILSRAFAQAFTGRAVLRRELAGGAVIEKQIFFDRGRPVFASSNQEHHDRMGQLLVREGKITLEQFSRCQTIVAASGRRMGEILVDLGYLKRRELLPAVRRHVEDIVYSLFAWNTGQFQLIAGDGASSERIRLSRHPAGMILEGVRRKLGTAELERLVGPATTVIELGDRDKLATLIGTADLSPEERAAVAAFDGTNDLAAVARASGADIANVLQIAWGLIVLGVAHARRRELDGDGDEGAVLVGETDLAIDRDRVRARWHLVSDADYFALLGVRRDASSFEIKRAYEAARRDFAPDGFPAELRRELARELDDIALVLDEAFHVLRDDHLRGAYLRHLRD